MCPHLDTEWADPGGKQLVGLVLIGSTGQHRFYLTALPAPRLILADHYTDFPLPSLAPGGFDAETLRWAFEGMITPRKGGISNDSTVLRL